MNTKADECREDPQETRPLQRSGQGDGPSASETLSESDAAARQAALTVESILAELKENAASDNQTPLPEEAPPEETPPEETPPRRPSPLPQDAPADKSARGRSREIITSVMFYGLLLALVVGVAILRGGSSSGAPVSFAGYTAQIVLTGSMEEVIPRGSLVIAKRVDPNTLQIGDDITYLNSQTTTITHRIIGITEEYADTGQRAFQTQGVMNERPDKTPVAAVNVVGKVVFHSLALGRIATFIRQNWPLLLFFAVLLAVLIKVLLRIRDSGADIDATARGTPLDKTDKKELGGKQE